MFEGQRILALIPARGGSKGLAGKNIRALAGKPLIAWSISAAKESRYVDRIIVSTDSEEIAAVSRQAGAETPFPRPAALATDQASTMDVCLHAAEWLGKSGDHFDLLLVLQPTSPLRTAADIDSTVELLGERNADAVVSVCETDHHPWWSNCLPEDGSMKDFLRPEVLHKTRQELPAYYRLNGAVYLARIAKLHETRSFYGAKTFAYRMPAARSVDIDSLQDFLLAETLLNHHQQS